MVWYAHLVECDLFRIFEEAIWSCMVCGLLSGTWAAWRKNLRQILCSQSTSSIRYSSLIFSGNRNRGSLQLCAKNMSVTYVCNTEILVNIESCTTILSY